MQIIKKNNYLKKRTSRPYISSLYLFSLVLFQSWHFFFGVSQCTLYKKKIKGQCKHYCNLLLKMAFDL